MLISILLSVLCIFVYLFWKYSKSSEDVIVGISGPSILQLLLLLYRNKGDKDNILKQLTNIHDKYGPTYCIQFKPSSPIVVTSDHRLFGQILASKDFLDKPSAYDTFKTAVGDSIVSTRNIDIWKNDRKVLNEAFGHESFKLFLENLDQKLYQLEGMILERMQGPINVQDVLHEFVMHSTLESLKDPNIEWDQKRNPEMNKAFATYVNNAMKRVIGSYLKLDFILQLAVKEATRVVRQFGSDLVDAHLNAKNIDPDNIINRMHTAGIPYDRIVDNAILFLHAAHETLAEAMSCILFQIAKQPEIQRKIYTEINGIVENNQNEVISAADLQLMKYTECVIKEGLRRHAPFSYLMRTVHKTVEVDDISIPKGTTMIFFIDALHKSAKYYKDPLTFNPDRFSAENKHNLTPNTWTPFSLGIRNCIGQALAMQKMKLILAKLVRKFEFYPVVPEHIMDVRAAFFSKSINGIKVMAKLR